MASCMMKASCQSRLVRSRARVAPKRSFRPVTVAKLNAGAKFEHAVAASTAFATLLTAGSAQAAQEIAALSANDSRLGTISLLFVPVVGWVGFNILGPAFRQVEKMQEENGAPAPKSSTKRVRKASIAAAIGSAALASMVTVQSAEAATQIAQIAESDSRLGAIGTLFLPALGWVAFNIFGPAIRQLESMQAEGTAPVKKGRK